MLNMQSVNASEKLPVADYTFYKDLEKQDC